MKLLLVVTAVQLQLFIICLIWCILLRTSDGVCTPYRMVSFLPRVLAIVRATCRNLSPSVNETERPRVVHAQTSKKSQVVRTAEVHSFWTTEESHLHHDADGSSNIFLFDAILEPCFVPWPIFFGHVLASGLVLMIRHLSEVLLATMCSTVRNTSWFHLH